MKNCESILEPKRCTLLFKKMYITTVIPGTMIFYHHSNYHKHYTAKHALYKQLESIALFTLVIHSKNDQAK